MSWLRARGLTRWLAPPVDQPVGIQVVHIVPPADVVDCTAARIAKIDKQIAEIAAVPPPARPALMKWRLDRLLEIRHAIPPAPPERAS